MKKRVYWFVIELLFCLILAGCGIANKDAFHLGQLNSAEVKESSGTVDSGKEDTLEVHYIDVGQGDSVFIKQGDSAMLIDAGNNDKGTTVWSYLLSQGVDSLEYAVGTHPDADHIGGLDVVLYKINSNAIFLPACENDTRTYEELIDTIESKNQHAIVPKQGETYSLGDAEFQILTNTDKDYGENKNDFSIALRLTFGNTAFLFTGDAEKAAEEDMQSSGLLLSSDVYKVSHHGADTANTEEFLKAVNPRYCVISCGQDNSYGHPRAGVLNTLRAMGVSVFRTDEQGTIVAISDGEDITFNCSPSVSWKPGEPTGSGDVGTGNSKNVPDTVDKTENRENGMEIGNDVTNNNRAENGSYILNTKTKKFHRENCSSVGAIADKNKQISDKTREQLMEEGYEPCKICNP